MDFYEKMGIVCRSIPAGRVASYGQIARLCGAPRNARQVGYGLRMDRAGKGVPAHRIVNHRGALSGAGHFLTFDTQRALLAGEGVIAAWDGGEWRVDLARYGWRPDAEALARLARAFGEDTETGEAW